VNTGAPGTSPIVTNVGTTSSAIFDFTIPRGSMLLSGTGTPIAQGLNGDFFLSTDTACLYGPKAGGAWPNSCMSLYGTNWRGTWASGTSYYLNDAVYLNGSSYRCKLPVTGTTSPDGDPTHWSPIALAGTAGLPPGVSSNLNNGLTLTGTPGADTDADTVGARNAALATNCPPGFAQTPPITANSFKQLYSDDFDRADGALNDTGSWVAVGSAASLNVSSNGVVAASNNSRSAWNQDPSPNQWASIKYSTFAVPCLGDCQSGLHLRESPDGNSYYYFAAFYSGEPMQFGWVKNGTGHMCGFMNGLRNGDEIKMSVTGSSTTTLTVYVNGTVAGSCTDTSSPILDGRYALISSPNLVLDSFKAGTVVSTAYSVCTATGAAPIAPGVTSDGANGINVKGAMKTTRNTLDDGTGNATIQGSLAAETTALKAVNGIPWADFATGTTVTAKIDAAVASLAGNAGHVVLSPALGSITDGDATSVPANVLIEDRRPYGPNAQIAYKSPSNGDFEMGLYAISTPGGEGPTYTVQNMATTGSRTGSFCARYGPTELGSTVIGCEHWGWWDGATWHPYWDLLIGSPMHSRLRIGVTGAAIFNPYGTGTSADPDAAQTSGIWFQVNRYADSSPSNLFRIGDGAYPSAVLTQFRVGQKLMVGADQTPVAYVDVQSADNSTSLVARRTGGNITHNLYTDGSGNGFLAINDSTGTTKLTFSGANGGITSAGKISAATGFQYNGTDGVTSTVSCAAGTHLKGITLQGGIATAVATCD
jgi:hypothetical protein